MSPDCGRDYVYTRERSDRWLRRLRPRSLRDASGDELLWLTGRAAFHGYRRLWAHLVPELAGREWTGREALRALLCFAKARPALQVRTRMNNID